MVSLPDVSDRTTDAEPTLGDQSEPSIETPDAIDHFLEVISRLIARRHAEALAGHQRVPIAMQVTRPND